MSASATFSNSFLILSSLRTRLYGIFVWPVAALLIYYSPNVAGVWSCYGLVRPNAALQTISALTIAGWLPLSGPNPI